MSKSMIDYGFKEYGFEIINASTDLANKKSAVVLERLGMSYLKQENIDGKETIFYQLKFKRV